MNPFVCVARCSDVARHRAFAQSDAHKMAEPKAPAPKSEGRLLRRNETSRDWEGP